MTFSYVNVYQFHICFLLLVPITSLFMNHGEFHFHDFLFPNFSWDMLTNHIIQIFHLIFSFQLTIQCNWKSGLMKSTPHYHPWRISSSRSATFRSIISIIIDIDTNLLIEYECDSCRYRLWITIHKIVSLWFCFQEF